MDKIFNFIKKNSTKKFIFIFLLGIIITGISILPTQADDAYCTIKNGYLITVQTFLEAGRIFTALVFYFYHVISLPFDLMGIIAIILSNVFLAISILLIFNFLNKKISTESKLTKLLLFISTFIMFYNPCTIEILIFDESFIMCLGIMFTVIASLKICKNNLKNYIYAFILCALGTLCYQGTTCYFIPLAFVLLLIDNLNVDKKEKPKIFIKKAVIAGLILMGSYLISYMTIQICLGILGTSNDRVNNFDILANINHVIFYLFPYATGTLFYYINPIIYYSLSIFLLVVTLILGIKQKNIIKFVWLLFTILFCFLAPFILNFATGSYTSARLASTICIIPSIITIFLIFFFKIEETKITKYLVYIIVGIYSIYIAYLFVLNNIADRARFREDMNSLNQIYQSIENYEKETNKKVTTIYFKTDSFSPTNYNFKVKNMNSLRMQYTGWSLDCAVNAYSNKKYKFYEMPQEDFDKYFKGKEYDEFNKEQLVFKNQTLYLLVY